MRSEGILLKERNMKGLEYEYNQRFFTAIDWYGHPHFYSLYVYN